MGLAIVVFAGLTGIATILAIGRQSGLLAHGHMARIPNRPTSPLDEAERILAYRYAKGEITPDEYSRMLSILRR